MDWQRRSLRVGAAVIALAVVLRLWSTGALEAVTAVFQEPAVASFLLYLETGRVVRPLPEETSPQDTVPETEPDTRPGPEAVSFGAEDAGLIYIRGTSNEDFDVAALLAAPLEWDLAGDTPTVLIYHTHATEGYTKSGEDYTESSAYRTLDTDYNMVSIGAQVAQLLEAGGIHVVCSDTLHDYPSYDGGYDNSRRTIESYLEQYPDIQLVLDLHRDAAVDENGNQYDTSAQVDGRESAQLMFLMSTGHDGWESNMALAAKLTAQLEKTHPGVTRGILTRDRSVYNQDMSPGCLLVEVGAAGNTREEALRAAEALANAILALTNGTE